MTPTIIIIFLGIGMLFQTLGSLALHRFPDVYTRLHGATKCTTFGSMFIYFGVILYSITLWNSGKEIYSILAIHTLIVMALIMVTNPTGAHAIARSAHRAGIMPEKAVVDKLREDGK